jgi:hypothetical protein
MRTFSRHFLSFAAPRGTRQMRTTNLAVLTTLCCLEFWRYDQAGSSKDHAPRTARP